MAFDITTLFTGEISLALTLIFFTAVIVIYSVFVFYFYRFLAKKNIIEYAIVLPILTFFWFAVLSILILLLAKGIDISTILLISAALVAAVRITSYISEDLSKDLAKMLPFTLLAIAITTAGFFDINALLARVTEIPSLFTNVLYYLSFIVAIELIMRVFTFFQLIFQKTKAEEEESPTEEKAETE